MSLSPDPPPPRRIRNLDLHRRAILDAAAETFSERGFQRATVREIARRAGVTHGLVIRNFGTKEQLFIEAVPGTRDLIHVAEGPLETLPERIADGYLQRMERGEGSDPFLALLRSAASDEQTAGRLMVAMQESSSQVYRKLLGADAMDSLIPFLAALLHGVTFGRYIVRAGRLAEMSEDALRQHLVNAIRALLQLGTTNPAAPRARKRTTKKPS